MPSATKLTLAFILLSGSTILLAPSAVHFVTTVHATDRTIALIGNYYYGWNYSQPSGANPTITINQGDYVGMRLSSVDVTHQFVVDVDGDGPADSSNCQASDPDPCSPLFTTGPPTKYNFTASMPAGSYTYYCTIHTTTMYGTFKVIGATSPDFGISSNPTSMNFVQGSSGMSTISLTSQNGFSGTVSLTTTVTPTGSSASLNPTGVPISSGGTGTSTLTVSTTSSTPSGSYTVTVTGSSGLLTHQTTVTVTVTSPANQGFNINSSPTALNVASGSSATATVTISSTNGFSGVLTLSGTVSPSSIGPSVSFSPSSVTVSSGGQATSTLTVSAVGGYYSSVATGNYSVNVTATNGSLSHSTSIQVTVGSPSSTPSGTGNLPLTALAVSAVGIVAAVGVVVYLVRKRTVSK